MQSNFYSTKPRTKLSKKGEGTKLMQAGIKA